jgi:hypothetical protein
VVASDASAGIPRSYGDDILKYTIRMFAPVASTDELVTAWSSVAGLDPSRPPGAR